MAEGKSVRAAVSRDDKGRGARYCYPERAGNVAMKVGAEWTQCQALRQGARSGSA